MNDFWFYIKLGFDHVLDFSAYDHILFLAALAVPYTFKRWKQVLVLATIFTLTHCTSLALSAYNIVNVDVALIEFLIPVTIALTAISGAFRALNDKGASSIAVVGAATAFFGLVHGFGFSNYFNMLMAEEEQKLTPLLGFATGIEFSQVAIIFTVLLVAFLVQNILGLRQKYFVVLGCLIILLVTIPILYNTFPL